MHVMVWLGSVMLYAPQPLTGLRQCAVWLGALLCGALYLWACALCAAARDRPDPRPDRSPQR